MKIEKGHSISFRLYLSSPLSPTSFLLQLGVGERKAKNTIFPSSLFSSLFGHKSFRRGNAEGGWDWEETKRERERERERVCEREDEPGSRKSHRTHDRTARDYYGRTENKGATSESGAGAAVYLNVHPMCGGMYI